MCRFAAAALFVWLASASPAGFAQGANPAQPDPAGMQAPQIDLSLLKGPTCESIWEQYVPPEPEPEPEPSQDAADDDQDIGWEDDDDLKDVVFEGGVRPGPRSEVKPPKLADFDLYYPPLARRCQLEGDVHLQACISRGGEAHDMTVLRSSGYELLDEAAIDSGVYARYAPATIDGEPVGLCGYELVVQYRLEKESLLEKVLDAMIGVH